MKMPQDKLLKAVKSENILKGICFDVFEIICESPGVTGGEVFLRYRAINPKTDRSRNEIAKRISDLRKMGAIKSYGSTPCPYTGKNVLRWAPTGALPDQTRISHNKRPKTAPVAPAVTPVTTRKVKTLTAEDMAQLRLMKNLLGQCYTVLNFKWLVSKRYRKQAEDVRDSLTWAIQRIENPCEDQNA